VRKEKSKAQKENKQKHLCKKVSAERRKKQTKRLRKRKSKGRKNAKIYKRGK